MVYWCQSVVKFVRMAEAHSFSIDSSAVVITLPCMAAFVDLPDRFGAPLPLVVQGQNHPLDTGNRVLNLSQPVPSKSTAQKIKAAQLSAPSETPFAHRRHGTVRLRWFAVGSLAILVPASPSVAADDAPNWIRVAEHASWQSRDSQGEAVFKDRLWILGGWFNSFEAPPRDVWSSTDGRSWHLVQKVAPWKHSDLPMTVVHNDRLWIMGGWYNGRLPGHSATNEVWSSSDGEIWELVTPHAGWSPRLAAGAVVFKDQMWILGGTEDYYFGDAKSLRSDVWHSSDGKQWEQSTESAGWSPRAYHSAVVHDGKLWVIGGGNYVPDYEAHNDVWCSEDGVHWKEVTSHAPWHPRLWFSSVVYRDRMWVLGGWSNHPARNWGDVWYSSDGNNWRKLESKAAWKERHEHSAFVFQDKILVAGGHAMPLSNEVWSLDVPETWFQGR